jgi:hypothetical protein
MNYTHHLSCSCTKAASGDPTSVGSMMTGKLVGDIRLYSDNTLSIGKLHTTIINCEGGTPLFNVIDLSPSHNPNSTYRIFINTNDLDLPPRQGDEFTAVSFDGFSYVYNILAVSEV